MADFLPLPSLVTLYAYIWIAGGMKVVRGFQQEKQALVSRCCLPAIHVSTLGLE